MDIKNILVADTNGDFSTDLFKLYPELPSVTVWLERQDNKRSLKLSPTNVRFSSVPNINNSTYKTFLTYNGTLGYSKKIFSTVVAQDKGVLDINDLPVLTYNPATVVKPLANMLDTLVIDIKMYNGTVNVLRYSEEILASGEKTYFARTTSYPTTITGLPNIEGSKVYMDGWYSYTTIVFRNLSIGDAVSKDIFYGFDGKIFKASSDGTLAQDSATGDLYILIAGVTVTLNGIKQVENDNYEQLLFSLNEGTGVSPQSNSVYLHSQIMILDEIRDAITAEIVEAAFDFSDSDRDFQNWQKLTLKQMGATVMFQNELYESAQIILESARSMCLSGRYNLNCK